MARPVRYRRDSRTSTIDYSDITELSDGSLWDRSISASNEDRAMYQYRRKLERRWDNANPVKQRGSMSHAWEMVNRIINRPVNGDDEAVIYLKQLVEGEDSYEATHGRDVCAPSWTILHKLAFYGCPKCVSYMVKHDADLFALDDVGNRPLDLARYGQSPAHRDIAAQLMEAMRKWREKDVLRRLRESKEAEEALLMEESGAPTFDDGDGGAGGTGGSGALQHLSYGDDSSAVTWGETTVEGEHSSEAERKSLPSLELEIEGGADGEAGGEASAESQAMGNASFLMRGLDWISGGRARTALSTTRQGATQRRGSAGSNSGSSGSDGAQMVPLPAIGGGGERRPSTVGSVGSGRTGGGDFSSGYSAVSAAKPREDAVNDGMESFTTASSPYSRVETRGGPSSVSSSVREGRRKAGPKVGANSRFVDPREKARNEERKDRELEVIREIYRADFRQGTFNQDLLPHVKATVDGLRDFVPTLDPRLAKHIEEDEVDEDDEYAAEAAVLHGQLNLKDFLEGRTDGVTRKKKPPRRPTYGAGGGARFRGEEDEEQRSASAESAFDAEPFSPSSSAGGAGSVASSRTSRTAPTSYSASSSSSSASSSSSSRFGGSPSKPIHSASSSKHVQRNRAKQAARGAPPPAQTSISAQRRTLAAVSSSRTVATELRYREGEALLGDPGWVSGSQAMASTLLYREARAAASQAEQAMADVPRLGSGAPLGTGSHAFRVGGPNEHAADKRLTALEALKQQRQKKWWVQKPSHESG